MRGSAPARQLEGNTPVDCEGACGKSVACRHLSESKRKMHHDAVDASSRIRAERLRCAGRSPAHAYSLDRPPTVSRSRRSAIHDVKVIAMREDNGTVRNLSCAQFCDLRCGVTLCRSLSDLEVFHIDIYALIARKLSDDVLSARTPIVGEASHQGRVLPLRYCQRRPR